MSQLQPTLSNNYLRFGLSVVPAIVVAGLGFYVMAGLVEVEKFPVNAASNRIINFITLKKESDLVTRDRSVLKRVELHDEPPARTDVSFQKVPLKKYSTIPKLDVPVLAGSVQPPGSPSPGSLDGAAGGEIAGSGGLVAVSRVAPRYPRRAAMKGLEGWVKLGFSLMPDGSVTDIEVIESEPGTVFNREAIRAIAKWKFRPPTNVESGTKFTQKIEFKLSK